MAIWVDPYTTEALVAERNRHSLAEAARTRQADLAGEEGRALVVAAVVLAALRRATTRVDHLRIWRAVPRPATPAVS